MKGPKVSICYWRISVTLGSGVAGFNCIYVFGEGGDTSGTRLFVENGELRTERGLCQYLTMLRFHGEVRVRVAGQSREEK